MVPSRASLLLNSLSRALPPSLQAFPPQLSFLAAAQPLSSLSPNLSVLEALRAETLPAPSVLETRLALLLDRPARELALPPRLPLLAVLPWPPLALSALAWAWLVLPSLLSYK